MKPKGEGRPVDTGGDPDKSRAVGQKDQKWTEEGTGGRA